LHDPNVPGFLPAASCSRYDSAQTIHNTATNPSKLTTKAAARSLAAAIRVRTTVLCCCATNPFTCGRGGASARKPEARTLCRYITRPAISEKRLLISPLGRVRCELKTPWKNGPTHVEFEPIDFIAKLAALVPPPRAHLTRFNGIFAPNANLRARLTPAGRGRWSATDHHPSP
jgi:hypothetical protein